MEEKEFWLRLEYRVCREIDGLRTREFRGLWCDGFIPQYFDDSGERPAVRGRVWMGRGGTTHQEQWRFSLLLPENVTSPEEIDWGSILPTEDVTGWLSLDAARRVMKIDSIGAYPDRQPDAS